MEDFYVLQNPDEARSPQQALRGEKLVPKTVLIPGPEIFDDQTLIGLMSLENEVLRPELVKMYGLRIGDKVTMDADGLIICINDVPVGHLKRVPDKFAYPVRRYGILDRNPVLAPAIYKSAIGYGQRVLIGAEPGKGKSTYGWAIAKEVCASTFEDETSGFYYISVGERPEDATEGEDLINSTPHRDGSVKVFSLAEGTLASSQYYQTWFACEMAEAQALSGRNMTVVIDCVSRLLGAGTDSRIPKPKNDGSVKQGVPYSVLLNVRRLVLAKGGMVRYGSGSLTIFLIMLLGEDNAESILFKQAGPAIETATWLIRDKRIIDIEKTATRQEDRFLHDNDPFTSLYRRIALMRDANSVEEVQTKGGSRPQTFTASPADKFIRHQRMVDLVLSTNSHKEAMVGLEALAKEWKLDLELSGSA
jgi:hypothetical protein